MTFKLKKKSSKKTFLKSLCLQLSMQQNIVEKTFSTSLIYGEGTANQMHDYLL